ncbi:UNVERIFIED_CONTAM: hypothetical protein NCL1_63462 [Trichonephila clavipes]
MIEGELRSPSSNIHTMTLYTTVFSAKMTQIPTRHRQLKIIDHGHLAHFFSAAWKRSLSSLVSNL